MIIGSKEKTQNVVEISYRAFPVVDVNDENNAEKRK